MARKVTLDGLADAVDEILQEYQTQVERGTRECVQKIAKTGVSALRSESPRRSGTYASGWTSKIESGRMGAKAVLYNSKRPGLAHLLEHGHVTRNGTGRTFRRTPAHVHIAPIEQELVSAFERDLIEVIQ